MAARFGYFAVFLLTIAIAVVVNLNESIMPEFVVEYQAGFFWGMMMFWLICVFVPRTSSLKVGLVVIALAFIMQWACTMYSDQLQDIMNTTVGNILFGMKQVQWGTLACSFVGIIVAMLLRKTTTRL